MINNWHPIIVHFPIVLVVVSLFFHSLSMTFPRYIGHITGLIILWLGAISAFLASLTGEKAYSGLQSEQIRIIKDVIGRHEDLANITTWSIIIFVLAWTFTYLKFKDRKWLNWIVLSGLTILCIFVLLTGYWGGELVYTHSVLNFR